MPRYTFPKLPWPSRGPSCRSSKGWALSAIVAPLRALLPSMWLLVVVSAWLWPLVMLVDLEGLAEESCTRYHKDQASFEIWRCGWEPVASL